LEKLKEQIKAFVSWVRKMYHTNEMVHLGAILLLLTLVVSLLLAAVNGPTSVAIAKLNAEKTQVAMEELFAGATFEKLEFAPTSIVSEVYGAYKDNALVGKVVFAGPSGFGGKISMIVGVDATGAVTGVEITGMSETAGLGTKTKDAAFKDQFIGKTGQLVVKKAAAADNEITAISGATISSTAVTNGVSAAIEAAASVK
jgi:electron transport complex protein RnfG